MTKNIAHGNIAFVSTFSPKVSNLGTFTENLVTTVDYSGLLNTKIVSIIEDENTDHKKIMWSIDKNSREDYVKTAIELNESNTDIVMIEHDFSIFGGESGEYILDFVEALEIPLLTTFHSIFSAPTPLQKQIIHTLYKKSIKIFVMSKNCKSVLISTYDADKKKIEVIPYGVPKKPFQDRETIKLNYGYEDKQIVSSFGLMDTEKGIEYGIKAIDKIVREGEHQNVLYLIIGIDHPDVATTCPDYRKNLEALVEELNLTEHVKFINRYLLHDELFEYLQLTDVFMTPFISEEHAVSGTLAYAVGYGKAIVSTPYFYAQEMLNYEKENFADFKDADSLAKGITDILSGSWKKSQMERNTAKVGRTMYLDKVASSYIKVILNQLVKIKEATDAL